jgi:hypothetical protein
MMGDCLIHDYRQRLTSQETELEFQSSLKRGWAPSKGIALFSYIQQGMMFHDLPALASVQSDTGRIIVTPRKQGLQRILIRVLFQPDGGHLSMRLGQDQGLKEILNTTLETVDYQGMHWLVSDPVSLKNSTDVFITWDAGSGGLLDVDLSEKNKSPVIVDGMILVPESVFWHELNQLTEFRAQTREVRLYSSGFMDAVYRLPMTLPLGVIGEIKPGIFGSGIETLTALSEASAVGPIPTVKHTDTEYTLDTVPPETGILSFMSSFSNLWNLNGIAPSIIVDSYANGFDAGKLESQEPGTLYFTADILYRRFVVTALILELLLLFSGFGALIWTRREIREWELPGMV